MFWQLKDEVRPRLDFRVHELVEHLLLAIEVGVERAFRAGPCFRDIAHRCTSETVLEKQSSRDIENVRAFIAGLLARHRHSRSEEHTSELQSLMRISYAVFCLKQKKKR